ncbi:hypothetical protein [Cetobacterium sp.]|uniref:hypothetical protein n=1 Tax=Cetobacterium sp. TaxID=2071632 RepID=UPI003F2DEB31
MGTKIKCILLCSFFLLGSLTFGQETSKEENKIEKGYLLEEYEAIREELNHKIDYIQEKSQEYQEVYKDILIEYESLKQELLKDVEKVKGELKE